MFTIWSATPVSTYTDNQGQYGVDAHLFSRDVSYPARTISRLTEKLRHYLSNTTAWQSQWTRRMNAYEDITEQDGVTREQTGWQRRPNAQQSHNQDRTKWEPANDKDTALDSALDKS